jgi:hypothetical protein
MTADIYEVDYTGNGRCQSQNYVTADSANSDRGSEFTLNLMPSAVINHVLSCY